MKIGKSWFELLREELASPYIDQLKTFLVEEQQRGHVVYPHDSLIFSAFSYTPFSRVRVVIVGQDPYHGAHQAHGLSFSVPRGVAIPPSLRNIYKELHADLDIPPASHGCLVQWAKQGVLLLNATLTVRAGEPGSHCHKGWERFTDKVVQILCESSTPIVFLLWGKLAQRKCQHILSGVDHPHAVLTSAHPSPFSAEKFLGCRHFSRANAYLKAWNRSPIDWWLRE